MRYPCHPAWAAAGEPVLRLRGCSTWEAVYERAEDGVAVLENVESIEDLAAFLDKCTRSIV
ncbi:MAG: hypothetical protein ACP5PV_04435 [Methanothrix sp.]